LQATFFKVKAMTRFILIFSVFLITGCAVSDRPGSNNPGTIWSELTNDLRRTDMAAPDKIGKAPAASNPFPEKSTWKDFENRIGNQVTGDAYTTQGPAAVKREMQKNP
jgi:spore germination cell wall hydrolase CwlJ-like protein